MSGWDDLVTTALLGTDRRPDPPEVPDVLAGWGRTEVEVDAAGHLLDLAAGYRALRRAAPPGDVESPLARPDFAPVVWAPARADELLGELLHRPDASLVNLWLTRCAERGLVPSPAHWTPLARLATRSSQVDRSLVHTVLGEAGRWFLVQNPAWHLVARPRPRPEPGPPGPDPAELERRARALTVDAPADLLVAVLACADPWSPAVLAQVWALLGSGRLGRQARLVGQQLGCRIPLGAYARISVEARTQLDLARPAPLQEAVLAGFTRCEAAAWTRIILENAFDPSVDAGVRLPVVDPSDPRPVQEQNP